MSDTDIGFVIGLIVVVAVGYWFSNRGKNVRYVSSGPSKEAIAEQKEIFSKMTVAELKTYIATKGRTGRLPSRKADIADVALQLWITQPW